MRPERLGGGAPNARPKGAVVLVNAALTSERQRGRTRPINRVPDWPEQPVVPKKAPSGAVDAVNSKPESSPARSLVGDDQHTGPCGKTERHQNSTWEFDGKTKRQCGKTRRVPDRSSGLTRMGIGA